MYHTPIKLQYPSDNKEKDLHDIQSSNKFQNWIKKLHKNFGSDNIREINVEYVKRFSSNNIGFLVLEADVRYEEKRIPGVVFLRGNSCGILVVLHCEGKEYTILTKQPRCPAGEPVLEIPAGTIDEGEVKGTAVNELEEECGIEIKADDLKMLHENMYMSPGGMDEQVSLFLFEKTVTKDELQRFDRMQQGLREHGEMIELRVHPFDDALFRTVNDAKSLVSFHAYRTMSGKI